MGTEMSAEKGNEYQNGNVKKDDDLRENGTDENDRDKESKEAQDMGSKYKNGDIRSRKPIKAGSRTKAELRKAILKTKQPSMNEQQKPIAIPKWLSPIFSIVMLVENTLPLRLRRLLVFLTIVGLAFGTRLFNVTLPPHICWDETHFGKHANYYLKGEFFFDVHPPLAKMSIALAGYLSGYNGSFPFDKPGDNYGENSYVGMRLFCAILGSLCVPLAYLTVWELTKSTGASLLSTAFIVFDHGCLTISQYILLDPVLMFCIMLSTYSFTKFQNCRNVPYTFEWWAWMTASGVSLSCAFSCKWVGLFVILWAGITTVLNLWDLLGDLSLSLFEIGKHFMARVLCLIMVPIFVYLFWFAVHFKMLPNT